MSKRVCDGHEGIRGRGGGCSRSRCRPPSNPTKGLSPTQAFLDLCGVVSMSGGEGWDQLREGRREGEGGGREGWVRQRGVGEWSEATHESMAIRITIQTKRTDAQKSDTYGSDRSDTIMSCFPILHHLRSLQI